MDKVRLRAEQRWYERLYHGPDYDIWVISWLPGQSTGFHDHGASSGAFLVATGILEEHRPGEPTRVIYPGKHMTSVTPRLHRPSAFTHILLRLAT
jgi:cysteine dioxygenase type I